MDRIHSTNILVTGATGYVGHRLVSALLERGYHVRAAVRNKAKVNALCWSGHPNVDVVVVDVMDRDKLERACLGCHAAYYLVHSMSPGQGDFVEADRMAAGNMAQAAEAGGLDRIIYLSGLGESGPDLSKHLASRHEVARVLDSGSVPVTVFRAGIILGSGSASFEIMRYLVDRLPVMVTPKWVRTKSQPIAIRNVLNYLVGCLEKDETRGESFDIGCPEILSYREIMEIYWEEAGLPRRWILPVPVLTPRLSSYWIHLVTPVHAAIARPLAQGLSNPALCLNTHIRSIIKQDLLSCREAMRLAVHPDQDNLIAPAKVVDHETSPPEWVRPGDAPYAGGKIFSEAFRIHCDATVEQVWKPVREIGGNRGWYFADFLWKLRGYLDCLLGGPGNRKGRRHPENLEPGDPVDSWRVVQIEEGKHLSLQTEMKVPGRARLEFVVRPVINGGAELWQISWFRPKGLFGLLYWYACYPFHTLIFKGMLRSLVRSCQLKVLKGPKRVTSVRNAFPVNEVYSSELADENKR